MKISNTTLNFLLVALAGFCASTTNATCDTYFYQIGSSTDSLYVAAYDHDDTMCDLDYSSKDLKEGEWVSVKANKDHESTIQVTIADSSDTSCGVTDCGTDFVSCDGSLQSKGECKLRKATCDRHYIVYVDDSELICEAATNDSGDVVTNENGDPYCADSSTDSTDSKDDSDCKSLSFEDVGPSTTARFLLRGNK